LAYALARRAVVHWLCSIATETTPFCERAWPCLWAKCRSFAMCFPAASG
jgi:hypothetical protein